MKGESISIALELAEEVVAVALGYGSKLSERVEAVPRADVEHPHAVQTRLKPESGKRATRVVHAGRPYFSREIDAVEPADRVCASS